MVIQQTFVALALLALIGCQPNDDGLDRSASESESESEPTDARAEPPANALVDAASKRDSSVREGGAQPGRTPEAAIPAAPRSDGGTDVMPEPADGGRASESPTHGRIEPPNYEVVFPKAKVNELTITITPANWKLMIDEMTRLWGPRGGSGPRPPTGGQPPAGGGAIGGFPTEDPIYAAASISFNGLVWSNVGVRFKGNSSLRAAWSSNSDRFPMRVNFDEYEDQHPEVKNQRFYGFKTLSLSTNVGDGTHMREALYYDLSKQAGLVTPARGFYELYLDRGEGRKSLGLYTVMEIVKDTVIPRHFEDPSGSLFKATNTSSNLAAGAKAAIPMGFEKEGGKGRSEMDADWAEIEALHDALHAPTRTSNAMAWRTGLESLLDVPTYLRWLALSTLFQHWDTYGRMPHNYYLYNDPTTKRFHWISWDHNFILGAAPGGGGGGGGGGAFGGVAFDKTNAGAAWPLITFLYADPTYRAAYKTALGDLTKELFEPTKMNPVIDEYAKVLMPYAVKSATAASYTQAVQALKDAISRQATAARMYLSAM
jgi:spore coat protein CotH